MVSNFAKDSYRKHIEEAEKSSGSGSLPAVFIAPNTISAWLHQKKFEKLYPLIRNWPQARWLTVGDGRFGMEAHFLQKEGVEVVASNLSSKPLEKAKSLGYIANFTEENAENMSAEDASFDFTLCKESYHHFPRPPVAFYEMLRVARQGVVLIEPQESKGRILDHLRNIAKLVLRGQRENHYEISGNFIYRVSLPEVSHMLMALDYPLLAYSNFNTFWLARFDPAQADNRSFAHLVVKTGILVQDILCRMGLMSWGLISLVAFKQDISPSERKELVRNGYRLIDLPRNPYSDKN